MGCASESPVLQAPTVIVGNMYRLKLTCGQHPPCGRVWRLRSKAPGARVEAVRSKLLQDDVACHVLHERLAAITKISKKALHDCFNGSSVIVGGKAK